MKILVTGGAGFIGSEFIRLGVKKGYDIIVVDKLTYAGDIKRLEEIDKEFTFYKKDICDTDAVEFIFQKENPDIVINFAAESHVDKSILEPVWFAKTNFIGTQILLDVSRKYKIKRFIQISTDEVYGEINKGSFHELSALNPSSPYSASKASADMFIASYMRTYNFPAIIVRPSNNYGPWQYPEKFIPVVIYKAFKDEDIPVYGKGENIREWLYVSDCVEAIFTVMQKGKDKQVYNIGSLYEFSNLDVAKMILDKLKKPQSLIKFAKDRPGHDFRYSLVFDKIKKLGWKQKFSFNDAITKTINWYKDNLDWVNSKLNSN